MVICWDICAKAEELRILRRKETKLNAHRKGPLVLCVDDRLWYELFVISEDKLYHTTPTKFHYALRSCVT